jgi:hypothetical protein
MTLRDVLTAGALITSVAALANSGASVLPFGHAKGVSDDIRRSTFDPRTDSELEGAVQRELRDCRFGRVEVREFALVDNDGRERASLNIDGSNTVRFRVGSDKSSESLLVSVFPDGRAALLMKDDRGRNRATMAIAEDGRPFMSLDERGAFCLDDERGQHQLVLRVHDNGKPEVWLAGKTVLPKGHKVH